MNTLNRSLTASFFREADGYLRLEAAWRQLLRSADGPYAAAPSPRRAAFHLLYQVLRGRDWRRSFAEPKDQSRADWWGSWGLRLALLHLYGLAGQRDELLAPFRELVVPDLWERLEALLPDRRRVWGCPAPPALSEDAYRDPQEAAAV